MTTKPKPYCCYMYDEHKCCKKDAIWEIEYGLTPDDYTHACDEHVGELLMPELVNTVYLLPQEPHSAQAQGE